MAHFAELIEKTDPTGFTSDTYLIVKRVIVVSNDTSTAAGPLGENDEHVDGETWCSTFFKGGTWKQTSYNHKFRKQYAGIGHVYDAAKNKFLGQQPFASWSLDANDDWQAPVPHPTDTVGYELTWDEDNTKWTGIKRSDQSNWNWDASSLTWVSA